MKVILTTCAGIVEPISLNKFLKLIPVIKYPDRAGLITVTIRNRGYTSMPDLNDPVLSQRHPPFGQRPRDHEANIPRSQNHLGP